MVNFCAVFGCSNRSNREKDKGYYRTLAIVSRSNPKKQALSVERLGSSVSEGKISQLTLLNFTEFAVTILYQVRNLVLGTVDKVYGSILAVVSEHS